MRLPWLSEQKPKEYLDRGLALLRQRGYVQFYGDAPRLTGEFHTNYRASIGDIRISIETPVDDMRHAMEKTLRRKGPASQEEVECMVYTARTLIAEINKDTG